MWMSATHNQSKKMWLVVVPIRFRVRQFFGRDGVFLSYAFFRTRWPPHKRDFFFLRCSRVPFENSKKMKNKSFFVGRAFSGGCFCSTELEES